MKKRKNQRFENSIMNILTMISGIGLILFFIYSTNEPAPTPPTHHSCHSSPSQKLEEVYIEFSSDNDDIDNEQIINSSDVLLLAGLIEAEGGICSVRTRERIGIVALNRVDSDFFPESLYDVISQQNEGLFQYETFQNGDIPDNPQEENLKIASKLIRLHSNSSTWAQFCLQLKISNQTIFEANESVDQSGYASPILKEHGMVNQYSYTLIFWESNLNASTPKFNLLNVIY